MKSLSQSNLHRRVYTSLSSTNFCVCVRNVALPASVFALLSLDVFIFLSDVWTLQCSSFDWA